MSKLPKYCPSCGRKLKDFLERDEDGDWYCTGCGIVFTTEKVKEAISESDEAYYCDEVEDTPAIQEVLEDIGIVPDFDGWDPGTF